MKRQNFSDEEEWHDVRPVGRPQRLGPALPQSQEKLTDVPWNDEEAGAAETQLAVVQHDEMN